MPAVARHLPSYCQGFASQGRTGCPRLWQGLVGLWVPGLGPTGSRLVDQSGYAAHGTLVNMDPATDWVAAPPGWMLDYDGTNDYVDCGGANATNLTADFTLAVWASTSAAWNPANNRYRPLATRNAIYGTDGYGLHIYEQATPATVKLEGWSKQGGSNTIVTYLVTTLWATNHVYQTALVLAGSTLRLYWDGREVASKTSALPPGSNSGPFRVGHGNSVLYVPWPGRIGTVAVWGRALRAAEIRGLYEDPAVLVRAARRLAARRLGPAPVPLGPGSMAAGEVFAAGGEAGQVQSTGSAEAEVFRSGAAAGQLYG
jgi:hypothetical protein